MPSDIYTHDALARVSTSKLSIAKLIAWDREQANVLLSSVVKSLPINFHCYIVSTLAGFIIIVLRSDDEMIYISSICIRLDLMKNIYSLNFYYVKH